MGYPRGIGGAVVATPLPSELASMAPGPDLAAVLASIDRSGLTADAMLDVIAARARLLWHVQGELLADLAQAVSATLADEPLRPDEDLEQVTDAVGELAGWTVHWARVYAQGQVEVAFVLDRRLPMVLAALRDGLIDQAKAAAFAEALACVDDETAVRIATTLLPKARRWTLTQLRASLRYHVDKADPGAARRRYRRRVAQRDVTLLAQPDGTASLYGQGLAPHRPRRRSIASIGSLGRLGPAAMCAPWPNCGRMRCVTCSLVSRSNCPRPRIRSPLPPTPAPTAAHPQPGPRPTGAPNPVSRTRKPATTTPPERDPPAAAPTATAIPQAAVLEAAAVEAMEASETVGVWEAVAGGRVE